jgi:hypothetical protein
MNYPGHVIKKNDKDAAAVKAIQQQLNIKGCGPIVVDGDFGTDTYNAVQLFQTRFADLNGNPLVADGIIGPITWASLFGTEKSQVITTAPNDLLKAVLSIASSQVGVMEVPPGSNNGPEVNTYQDAAGVPHGEAWCMAFVYWCFKQACANLGIANPVYKTGGVLDEWDNTTGKKILAADAQVNTSLVLPGQIFIISTGGGFGHTGFIESINNGLLTTIEGNTNTNGSRNGIGVFRRTARTINKINVGFIQFG